MNNHMEKTLSQMWDLMDFSQQPTLSQTASIWVKISYLTIRKADFWFGGLLKHLSVRMTTVKVKYDAQLLWVANFVNEIAAIPLCNELQHEV